MSAINLWRAGEPLIHGTKLARFMIRGDVSRAIRARPDAQIGFASGDVGAPPTSYGDMIGRVRAIVDEAVGLIDRAPQLCERHRRDTAWDNLALRVRRR
jgi:hypothetical protein